MIEMIRISRNDNLANHMVLRKLVEIPINGRQTDRRLYFSDLLIHRVRGRMLIGVFYGFANEFSLSRIFHPVIPFYKPTNR